MMVKNRSDRISQIRQAAGDVRAHSPDTYKSNSNFFHRQNLEFKNRQGQLLVLINPESTYGFSRAFPQHCSNGSMALCKPIAATDTPVFAGFTQPLPDPGEKRFAVRASHGRFHAPIFAAFRVACGDVFKTVQAA